MGWMTSTLLVGVAAGGLLAVGACDGRALAARDPRSVQSGIYDLDIEPLEDTCEPAEPVGHFSSLAVFTDPKGISLWEPTEVNGGLSGIQTQELLARHDYQGPPGFRLSFGCATLDIDWRLVAATDSELHAQSTHRWTVAAGCIPDAQGIHVPARSCTSERLFRYQLQTPCESACIKDGAFDGQTLTPTLTCSCDG
jgi:hypothetical protein